MRATPYLMFNGNCEAAFKFYEQCLGGTAQMSTFAGTPAAEHVPAEMQGNILHACLTAGDVTLMGSDCPPDSYQQPAGISVALHINDPAEAERVFNALAEGGTVQMPLDETFWAARFGMVTDRFGTPWMINCEKAA